MSGTMAATGDPPGASWTRLRTACLALWILEGAYFLLLAPAGPLQSDAANYWVAGHQFLAGAPLTTIFPPLYPLICALFQATLGQRGLLAVQTLLVAGVGLWFQGWLARRHGVRPAAVFVAGMVLFPVLYVYARFVLTDVWLALALLLFSAWTADALDGLRGFGWGAGALVVATALRPEGLVVAILAAALVLRTGRSRGALQLLAPVLVETLLWGTYNHLVRGQWVFTEEGFWINLWAGNQPGAYGVMVVPAQGLGAGVYRHLVLGWMESHPLALARLVAEKAWYFWMSAPQFIQVLAVQAGIVPHLWLDVSRGARDILDAALVWGLWRLRGAWAGVWPPLVAIAALWAFTLVFFAMGRFWVDLTPLLLMLVACAAARPARAGPPRNA